MNRLDRVFLSFYIVAPNLFATPADNIGYPIGIRVYLYPHCDNGMSHTMKKKLKIQVKKHR